jgi:hypothetical protein
MGVSTKKLWASLRTILANIFAQEDGTFLLMKDANKQRLVLYSIPEDETFQDPA